MQENQRQVIKVSVNDCQKADWNYKTDGTEEDIAKLTASIEKDRSAGILAVREVILETGKKVYEIIDGNHRFEAVKRMGWQTLLVENFGEISIGEAGTIARRRNHNWFQDDVLKLQKLYNDHIFKQYTAEQLTSFMPDSAQFLDSMKTFADINWNGIQVTSNAGGSGEGPEVGFKNISISLPEETYQMWLELKETYKNMLGEEQQDYRVFEFAIIEASNSAKNQKL